MDGLYRLLWVDSQPLTQYRAYVQDVNFGFTHIMNIIRFWANKGVILPRACAEMYLAGIWIEYEDDPKLRSEPNEVISI